MAESVRLTDLVQNRINQFLSDRTSILGSVARELAEMSAFSWQFLSGGKRFRALFCYWGWRAAAGGDEADDAGLRASISAASALELFHAAALVHDDVIDRSDTRRGAPAAHRRFEAQHRAAGWAGSAESFGVSSAILVGDLLLGWSDELLDEGLAELPDRTRARRARSEFNRMRTEVTAGQYLDILEENAWAAAHQDSDLSRAQRVIVYKSAKYSVEAPLRIGARIAGATDGQLETLSAFALPLGIAYQLRDDLLGVFGDSALTGKPSGDDLREGKRTVLIALARASLPASARTVLDELLGDATLTDVQVRMLQRAITDAGAVEAVEAMIRRNVQRANAALDEASLAPEAIAKLRELTRSVTDRVA